MSHYHLLQTTIFLLRLTIIHREMTIVYDVALSISLKHSWTPCVALPLAMKLREEFSPTPPHFTLLIRVGKLALVRLSAGRAWKECYGRDSLIKGGTSSTYVFIVSIAFCLCLFVVFFLFPFTVTSVLCFWFSVTLFTLVIYNQSLLNPHPCLVSAVL